MIRMKNIKAVCAIALALALFCGSCLADIAPDWISALGEKLEAYQLIITAATAGTSYAEFYMAEKDANGLWQVELDTTCLIGSCGLGKQREGDKKTPTGVFNFNKAFGCADDPGCLLDYKKATEDDYWSGDTREGYGYNTLVSIKDYPDLMKGVSEHIIDTPVSYKYCLNISYNDECVIGNGSAIFLHCIKPGRTYTSGCIAIPEADMLYVITHVTADCMVVIDYKSELTKWTSLE